MRNSTKAAVAAGAVTAAAGIVLAVLCPLAGMIGGGYLAYGALTAAGFSTAGTVALTAGGALVGLIVGRIAKPLVGLLAVGLGAATGGLVKLFGSAVETVASSTSSPSYPEPQPSASTLGKKSGLSAKFGAGKPAGGNAAPAQIVRDPVFKL